MQGLPPRPDTEPRIEIRLKLDINGMLTASARDTESDQTAELDIDYEHQNNAAALPDQH